MTHVLIVEDHEENRTLLGMLLEANGYRVTAAGDGLEALDAARRDPPDVVVSDVLMPKLDGFALCRAWMQDPALRAIPFIFYSANYVHPEDQQFAMGLGAVRYLIKPLEAEVFLEELRAVLRHWAGRAAPAPVSPLDDVAFHGLHEAALGRTLEDKIAQLEQANRKLQESELRFHRLTEMSSDFFWESDAEHRLTQHSGAGKAGAVLAFRQSAWLGERRWEIPYLSPDEAGWQAHRAALEAHQPFREFELSRLGTDGKEHFVSVSGDPVFDASGAFRGYRGVGRDITERVRRIDDLRRLRAAMDATADAIFLVDRTSMRFIYVNDAACRMQGCTREVLLALGPDGVLSASRAELERTYDSIIAGGAGIEPIEMSRQRKDGSRVWVELRRRAQRSGEGWMIVTVVRDVTERKAAENRIRRLNRVYAVLSGINTLIVRVRDRDEVFRETCRIAVEDGQFQMAWIGVVDRSAMKIVPLAWAGADAGFLEEVRERLSLLDSAPAGHGPPALAVREKQAVIVNDVEADARILNKTVHADRGIRSSVSLPLLIAGEAVGVFCLHVADAGYFDEAEMKLLRELAHDIAFAIENIGRQQEFAKLARTRALSGEINAAIIRIHDREELFTEACRIAIEHGQFKMAWIGVADRSAMKIVPIASAGAELEFLTLVRDRFSLREDVPDGNTMSARAVRSRKPVVSNDIREGPSLFYTKERLERGIASIAVLPLLVADEAVGVFVLYAGEFGFFDEEEMTLLTELAGNISFALDHIEKEKKLDYLAYYDVLTGLANRSLFLERLAQYVRGAGSSGHKLALVMIDLERFKNINDSLGRPAGDALLRQVAEWLTHNVGDANLLGRVGADHFAAVMPQLMQEGDAARALEKAMEDFLGHPFRLNDAVFRIAFKAGVGIFPNDGIDADTLFKNAEAALKKAKTGGDRYLFHTRKMTEAVAGKLTLENQLRQALDKGEFVLHYQPKVNLASGKMTSAEALIRWNDPRTGLVPPGRFIPVLEETGLIHEVGRWALRQAIDDYLRWRAAGLAAVRIAVNVSPLQLRQRGFIAEIAHAIGIDAQAAAGIELEITESVIMADITHTIASLRAVRALGVSIAIDDFGTGFSSLSYLAKLPVDTLKIDRSFVIEMTAGPEGLALVSTIISLAHALNLKVVAEGVETEEQSRLLRLLSCDEMQGFLFSKPVPVEIFEARYLAAPAA